MGVPPTTADASSPSLIRVVLSGALGTLPNYPTNDAAAE
jgi:hypothetical protein